MIKILDYYASYIQEEVVLLLGYFDGMHLGHMQLLNRAKNFASENEYKLAIMTFYNSKENKNIFSFQERLFLYQQLEIDYCIVAQFDSQFRNQTGETFLKHLMQLCSIKAIVCGEDFLFGKNGQYTVQFLQEFCKQKHIHCFIESLLKIDEQKISTSQMREFVLKGDLRQLEKILDRKYFIMGTVQYGNQFGRKINFPTANIAINTEKVMLKNGVYAVTVAYENNLYKGVANLGHKPTIGHALPLLEVHILNFNQEIYGKQIIVYFDKFLRNIQKFDSIQQLKKQIEKDVKNIYD